MDGPFDRDPYKSRTQVDKLEIENGSTASSWLMFIELVHVISYIGETSLLKTLHHQ